MAMSNYLEIRRNFEYFQSVVASLMVDHEGEYALLRNREIIDYFCSVGEAVSAGAQRYGATPFSIQRVWDQPIDLGFLSYAAGSGTTD